MAVVEMKELRQQQARPSQKTVRFQSDHSDCTADDAEDGPAPSSAGAEPCAHPAEGDGVSVRGSCRQSRASQASSSYGSRVIRAIISDSCISVIQSTKSQRETFIKMYQEGTLRQQRPTARARVQHFTASGHWLGLQLVAVSVDMVLLLSWLRAHATHGAAAQEAGAGWQNLLAVLVCCVYTLDVGLRIWCLGPGVFLSKFWNVFDVVAVLLVLVATGLTTCGAPVLHLTRAGLLQLARVARLVRVVRATSLVSRTCPAMRRITGENKRRFVSQEHDFDLDLVYVTPRLISMSVPAAGPITRLYRNPLHEVVRFFETFHAECYLVVNACPELPYPSIAFQTGLVELFDVQDHAPPLMSQVVHFLHMALAWTAADAENVLAVHCRGGKGRTGSFCCAWLLYTKEAEDAQDALNFYAVRRTDMDHQGRAKVQGVETPSQVRYVEYVERLLRQQGAFFPRAVQLPAPVDVRLRALALHGMFRPPAPSELVVAVHDVARRCPVHFAPVCAGVCDLGGVAVQGDVRVSVFGRGALPAGAELIEACRLDAEASAAAQRNVVAGEEPGCLFYFLVHTSFLEGEKLWLRMPVIDKACKQRKLYRESGSVELSFSRL
mmetsp:Transcript_82900/g.257802  ORF Transcript_82900/g.257802 Transcript_82900/m.257802 type:complete len:608 (+) Transcript_82900:74-1897(+)